jgi:hypothetical protein
VKRTCPILGAIFLLTLLACCSPGRATVASSPPLPATRTASVTSLPTVTATPRPTATWVPTRPPLTPTPAALSPDVLEAMDAIAIEMEELRGLEETAPITRTLMTRQELAAYLERDFAEEYPPEEIQADVQTMAAFDFVPEDFDLQRVLLDLYSTQILGMYDEEKNTFYLISEGKFDLLARITFAHEYTHGLQDEHFQLDTFVDEDRMNDDEILARMALVEGDASLAMSEYVMAHLSELTPQDLAALQVEDDEASQAALEAAPPIVRETFDFPYVYGQEFVEILQQKGWQAVDTAFVDPPQSTEQILHPEKYLSRDEPQIVTLPPLTDTLGADWHLVEADTLGEFQTNLYLAQQVDQETADLASEGWDGDRYALYAQDGAEVLVFATAWDSPADREEFVAAYGQYAEGKYGGPATRTGQAELWWETPDQAAVLTWGDTNALIVLGPDPATAKKVLAVVGLPPTG